ncbi:MAG: response regulator transcription factor [Acidimicrobiia bacterium]|nr:response regulator transcription factor [Acidimicrobiia bacterium]
MPEPATIGVFLLDDHEVVRRGVAEMVNAQTDMEVVGEAGNPSEAMAVVAQCEPDIAVLDVRLGEGNGIAVCREIRSEHPDVACLILTSFDDDQAIIDAALAGASGFVLKQIRGNELIESMRKVARGAQLLDAAATRMAMQRLSREEVGPLAELTEQERRVFELIGAGLSNREIGEELYLAEKTVKNYVTGVLAKLGMARRTEAAALAARIDERKRQHYN